MCHLHPRITDFTSEQFNLEFGKKGRYQLQLGVLLTALSYGMFWK